MNGPEHYGEAERLAERAYHFIYGDGADPGSGHALAALAQVHATLALAAATVVDVMGVEIDAPAWSAALGRQRECRVCRCTDDRACEGGCSWVTDPEGGHLCSTCAEKLSRTATL